jgi:hypothetical protein
MEALAAVSLASNIVQLINFVGEVLSKSGQIYRSRPWTSEDEQDQEFIASHLRDLSNKIQCPSEFPDPALEKLCSQCNGVADDLLATLGGLRNQGQQTRSQSLRKSLKLVWGKDKVLKLERRLQALRQELSFHILFDLRYVSTPCILL